MQNTVFEYYDKFKANYLAEQAKLNTPVDECDLNKTDVKEEEKTTEKGKEECKGADGKTVTAKVEVTKPGKPGALKETEGTKPASGGAPVPALKKQPASSVTPPNRKAPTKDLTEAEAMKAAPSGAPIPALKKAPAKSVTPPPLTPAKDLKVKGKGAGTDVKAPGPAKSGAKGPAAILSQGGAEKGPIIKNGSKLVENAIARREVWKAQKATKK